LELWILGGRRMRRQGEQDEERNVMSSFPCCVRRLVGNFLHKHNFVSLLVAGTSEILPCFSRVPFAQSEPIKQIVLTMKAARSENRLNIKALHTLVAISANGSNLGLLERFLMGCQEMYARGVLERRHSVHAR
jgi:hypothetical protein